MTQIRFALALALGVAVLMAPVGTRAESCVGDADGDLRVTIAELVLAVRHAADGCPALPGVCHADADGDTVVIISELTLAVVNALSGCRDDSDLVVDVDWLVAHLGQAGLQVIDARAGGFDGAHIPGALPLSPYALATTVEGVDFQIVGADAGEAALAAIGLRSDSIVVVYGTRPEIDPARVVWALRYLGHADVRYLDGGWDAWVAAGASAAAGPPLADTASDYRVEAVREEIRVTGDWLLEQLGAPPYDTAAVQLVDARTPAEFAAGHIPTALNVPWTLNLTGGLLLARTELTSLYAGAGLDPRRTTIVYCTAGWRASVDWLALTWLGFADVRVYDGSWLEWRAGGRFPIER